MRPASRFHSITDLRSTVNSTTVSQINAECHSIHHSVDFCGAIFAAPKPWSSTWNMKSTKMNIYISIASENKKKERMLPSLSVTNWKSEIATTTKKKPLQIEIFDKSNKRQTPIKTFDWMYRKFQFGNSIAIRSHNCQNINEVHVRFPFTSLSSIFTHRKWGYWRTTMGIQNHCGCDKNTKPK